MLSFVLLAVLIPDADDELSQAIVSFTVVTALVSPATIGLGTWMFRPVERWLASGRPATAQEQAAVVTGPRRVAVIVFASWWSGGSDRSWPRRWADGHRSGQVASACRLLLTWALGSGVPVRQGGRVDQAMGSLESGGDALVDGTKVPLRP